MVPFLSVPGLARHPQAVSEAPRNSICTAALAGGAELLFFRNSAEISFGFWNFKKCKQGEGQDDPSEEEEHIRPAEVLQGEQTVVVSCWTVCPVLGGRGACTVWALTAMYWKQRAIRKLQTQLLKAARARAVGRGPWLKNSATMNQGIGPGPISKKLTKRKMAVMLT